MKALPLPPLSQHSGMHTPVVARPGLTCHPMMSAPPPRGVRMLRQPPFFAPRFAASCCPRPAPQCPFVTRRRVRQSGLRA